MAISNEDIGRAMKAAAGDKEAAALALGVPLATLEARVERDPQLRAAYRWEESSPSLPGAVEMATGRQGGGSAEAASVLSQIISRENQFLLRRGLADAGIRTETIDRLAKVQGMEISAPAFLITSLDLSHRLMVVSAVELFERLAYIKEKYLENETLDEERKLEWQKVYNQGVDQLGRFYDRTQNGTESMVRIFSGGKQRDQARNSRKRAFTPYRDAPAEAMNSRAPRKAHAGSAPKPTEETDDPVMDIGT